MSNTVNLHATLPAALHDFTLTIDGRSLSLAQWIMSVESRLHMRGMTLADLDKRTVRSTMEPVKA